MNKSRVKEGTLTDLIIMKPGGYICEGIFSNIFWIGPAADATQVKEGTRKEESGKIMIVIASGNNIWEGNTIGEIRDVAAQKGWIVRESSWMDRASATSWTMCLCNSINGIQMVEKWDNELLSCDLHQAVASLRLGLLQLRQIESQQS
eukprot:Filipodium_phascolosomae@DN1302_c0_g1_i2.p1